MAACCGGGGGEVVDGALLLLAGASDLVGILAPLSIDFRRASWILK